MAILKSVTQKGITLKTKNNTLYVSGQIDCQDPSSILKPYFNKLHNHIIKNKISVFNIDVTELYFINSAGIKEIVDWILKIESLPINQKYKLLFLSNTQYVWQEASFSSLKFLSPNIVNIKIL
jgi:hypothetical protein